MNADTATIPPTDVLIAYFVTRPDEFAWPADVRKGILARRAAMSNLLFFDHLLQLGGVDDPATIYPPANLHGLKRLLEAIEAAAYDSMKRDCLVYYLLKQSSDGREVGYISEKVISPHYVSLADAYWELDSGLNIEGAIAKLSDARIVKEYTTKIMETLQLDPNSSYLIRKFVRTCRPPLQEPNDMERYVIATAEQSIAEAWKYQRTFPSSYSARKPLLRKILIWTLTPKPKSSALKQLLALPFSKYEDAVLQDFAVKPPEDLPAASVEVVRDLVCVRLIQSCKYAAAVRFDRQYPSSAAAPRGTWGAERGRIVKEILSIMPRVERDSLENEATALDQDARIRNSAKANASMDQSWTNLAASGSTDLNASWEDLGRRTTATGSRKSFGGRPRTSLPNGTPAKPMFTPGASTSSPWSSQAQSQSQQQPLSGQSTFVSQNGSGSAAKSPLRAPQFVPYGNVGRRGNSGESPSAPSAARLFAQRVPPSGVRTPTPAPASQSQSQANGVPNGAAQGAGAFKAKNAFYVPPAESRTPSPVSFEVKSTAANASASASKSASPKRSAQPGSATRLPTPPQDEAERTQEASPTGEGQVPPVNDQVEIISSASSINNDVEREELAEPVPERRGGLGFSIFGRSATSTPAPAPKSGSASATRLSPASNNVSPSNRRKFQDEGTGADSQSQRKKLKVSVPGAFVSDIDDDHEHEQEHEHEGDLPSPTSATVSAEKQRPGRGRGTTHRTGVTPTRTLPPRRSSRKRSASPEPEEEEIDSHPISIPGTLFEEDEDEYSNTTLKANRPNGNVNSTRDKQKQNGAGYGRAARGHNKYEHSDADAEGESEGADELAPLPKHRSKHGLASSLNASGSLRTPRRGARSIRGSSAEPDVPHPQSTGRPVRRSSRLQSVDVSPTAEQMNRNELKLKDKLKEKETRPKKSTRTTGAGATATGRGSSRRR